MMLIYMILFYPHKPFVKEFRHWSKSWVDYRNPVMIKVICRLLKAEIRQFNSGKVHHVENCAGWLLYACRVVTQSARSHPGDVQPIRLHSRHYRTTKSLEYVRLLWLISSFASVYTFPQYKFAQFATPSFINKKRSGKKSGQISYLEFDNHDKCYCA